MKTNENSLDWRLEGDYFDGCNCPCIFAFDPTEGHCEGIAAWHIEKGYFITGAGNSSNRDDNNKNNNSIDLANLNVIMSVHAPGHMFKGPKWKVALYLDERANNDQTDALTKIFTGQAGGGDFFAEIVPLIGEILGIKSVSIEFTIEGKRRRKIKIPSIVEMEIEGLVGSDPNIESKVVNPAFSNTPGYDPVIAHSLRHTYQDHGLEWDNSGRNAFYSRFTYSL